MELACLGKEITTIAAAIWLNTSVSFFFEKLGLAQGLFSPLALPTGNKGPEKGPMASSSSAAKRNKTPKPSWADMVTGEKPKEHKEVTKDEPMEEEEEWWQRDWKKKGQSWDQWWQDKRQEWDEWKKSEREEMQREEQEYQERIKAEKERQWQEEEKREMGNESEGKEEANPPKQDKKLPKDQVSEEEKDEEEEKRDRPVPRWENRNGSQKERSRRRWAEDAAERAGEDPAVARLGAIGKSRMKRLISRQEDRMTFKQTVGHAEKAAANAAAAAQAACAAQWQTMYQGYYYWPQGLWV